MPVELSTQGQETFDAIVKFREKKHYSPSITSIAEILGVSIVTVYRRMDELQRKRVIKAVHKKAIQIKDEIPYNERQHGIMKLLLRFPDLNQVAIAAKLGISGAALHEHLENLERIGAIEFDKGDVKIRDKNFN